MYYIHSDYLGNYETVTNERGNMVDKLSFDPCLPARNAMEAGGRRRNPTDWTYNNVPQTHLFDRSFTGHSLSRHAVVGKHLDNFDLINMPARRSDSIGGNGRVYDPVLGYFTTPDPMIAIPGSIKDFNLYAYTKNNPLSFVDPTGYWDEDPYEEDDFQDEGGWLEVWDYYRDGSWCGFFWETLGNLWGDLSDFFTDNRPYQDVDEQDFGQYQDGDELDQSFAEYDDYTQPRDGDNDVDRTRDGETGGGDGITLSETETMATVMGWTNSFTKVLIDWGLSQATTPWGNSISGFNKFLTGSGKFLGYYSSFVYGIQARNAYNNGDRLHTLSNPARSDL